MPQHGDKTRSNPGISHLVIVVRRSRRQYKGGTPSTAFCSQICRRFAITVAPLITAPRPLIVEGAWCSRMGFLHEFKDSQFEVPDIFFIFHLGCLVIPSPVWVIKKRVVPAGSSRSESRPTRYWKTDFFSRVFFVSHARTRCPICVSLASVICFSFHSLSSSFSIPGVYSCRLYSCRVYSTCFGMQGERFRN